jgi:Phage integrase, N-terminal SAM-like domain
VTHLRKIMLEELQRHNYAQTTIDCYVRTVEHFSRYFHRSPDQLGPQHIREYLPDAYPDRSAAASARWWSDPACTRPAQSPQNAAAPANPPTARQSRAPPRCPRNIQSTAIESKFPASARAVRTWPHRTSRTAARQTRQNPRLPATRSASGKRDAPERLPTRCAQSTIPLASPSACACPSPYADSTNTACGYLTSICLRI